MYRPLTKFLGKKVKVLIHVNISVKLVFRPSVVGLIVLTKYFKLKGVLLPFKKVSRLEVRVMSDPFFFKSLSYKIFPPMKLSGSYINKKNARM